MFTMEDCFICMRLPDSIIIQPARIAFRFQGQNNFACFRGIVSRRLESVITIGFKRKEHFARLAGGIHFDSLVLVLIQAGRAHKAYKGILIIAGTGQNIRQYCVSSR